MTIRAKLTLSFCVQLGLVVAVGVVMASTLQAINHANAKNARVFRLNEAITEMRFITFEHLLNHDQRSLEQWQSKYRSLSALLVPASDDTPAERRILADMTAEHQAVKSLFERLDASYNQPGSQTDPTLKSFQERLADQLLVRQQAKITDAAQLAELSRTAITTLQWRALWLVLGAIGLMLIIIIVNARLVAGTITASLATLQRGATAIAGGNLAYRITTTRRDEFGQLAEAFNTMAAGLQRIDQTKSEFILMVSHQLRTPATGVKGFLSLLLDGYLGKLPARQRSAVQDAQAENERQLQLVDEILVVAQAETGEMTLAKTSTDLGQLVEAVVAAQTVILKARHQEISLQKPAKLKRLNLDATKLRLVIENLITNASQYSPSPSQIQVTLHQTTNEVRLTVIDQGYGIAAADYERLFKKFSRLTNTGSARIEGAGLGLYLAQKIVDLHQGRITVHSRVGQGSMFTIHLPS